MLSKIRIGIDFDNTLICYENLFSEALKQKNWQIQSSDLSKKNIKQGLIEQDGNDYRWQELQAIVYGNLILYANEFEGVKETLNFLNSTNNFELYVVSHKSERSHYLPNVTLIDKAYDWIKKNNFHKLIPLDNISFHPTRAEKINKIKDLHLHFFIDDLEEVLLDENFPAIQKILFQPTDSKFNSWAKIRDHFEVINELPRTTYTQISDLITSPLTHFQILKRHGNNKISSFSDHLNQQFIIKKYSNVSPEYSPLQAEFRALEMMYKENLPVPKPVFCDEENKLAIYEQIKCSSRKPTDLEVIHDFSAFLHKLYTLTQKYQGHKLTPGRDARQKNKDYNEHIIRRLVKIEAACATNPKLKEIQTFLDCNFKPLFQKVNNEYKLRINKYGINENSLISQHELILSPSDFGTHNALFNLNQSFTFIDFEYFGLDDCAKLIADFLHHAGQELSEEVRIETIGEFLNKVHLPPEFYYRLSTILDLVGLEWILIMLNVADPEVLSRRMYANPELNVETLLSVRLENANKKANLFHTQMNSNSVFWSLKSPSKMMMERLKWPH